MKGRAAIALLALSCMSAPARAQTYASSPEIVAAASTPILGLPGPIMTIVEEPQMRVGAWSVIGVYDAPVGYVARRVRRRGPTTDLAWIDVARCPALRDALGALATIDVRIHSPFDPNQPAMALDGTVMTVWAQLGSSQGRAMSDVRFSSNSGPLYDWMMTREKAFESCWAAEPPKGVSHR